MTYELFFGNVRISKTTLTLCFPFVINDLHHFFGVMLGFSEKIESDYSKRLLCKISFTQQHEKKFPRGHTHFSL